jgi:hypothetical protein
MDEEVLTGEVESEPARALSPRQAVLLAAEHLRAANHDLNRDPGERPSVEVHQATIAGIAYGLTVVADRLADDEGLRPAVAEALDALMGSGAQTYRMENAGRILRRAAGL